jgi:predicted Holliday junction resolvase-like endonuclease
MDQWVVFAWLAAAGWLVVISLAISVARRRAKMAALAEQLRLLASAKQSQSTRYGQITEQFAPFLATWPWDPKRFKFLGDPIDGVQFTNEGIVFVEIKSARSRLTPVQRQVREHVQAGRVAWHEVRIG